MAAREAVIMKQEEDVDDGDGMCSDDSGDRSSEPARRRSTETRRKKKENRVHRGERK